MSDFAGRTVIAHFASYRVYDYAPQCIRVALMPAVLIAFESEDDWFGPARGTRCEADIEVRLGLDYPMRR